MSTASKRDRLVEAASMLFHHYGFHSTSLADIAKEADIPIGNVYYYFKAKEELALAVLKKYREQFASIFLMLNELADDPRQRLINSLSYYEKKRDDYARHGCPIGKVVSQCEKEKDAIAKAARSILADYTAWAASQFEQLGHADTARACSMYLMSCIQGAILMAKAFEEPDIITQHIDRLTNWIEQLPNRKVYLGKAPLKP